MIDQIFSALNHDEKLERIHSHLEAVRQRLEQDQVPLAELAITKEVSMVQTLLDDGRCNCGGVGLGSPVADFVAQNLFCVRREPSWIHRSL